MLKPAYTLRLRASNRTGFDQFMLNGGVCMNKKFFAVICVIALLASGFAVYFGVRNGGKGDFNNAGESGEAKESAVFINRNTRELRGAWLTYYEISKLCSGKSESEYRASLTALLAALGKYSINTVFYQARAFSDSLYFSDNFPVSKYIVGSDGQKPDFDPLKVFIECAKEFNIDVHAWVNPFRISYGKDITDISSDHPAQKLYSEDKSALIICESGIYYNPASDRAIKLLLDGIRELVSGYDIKGIQFDDYFYPPCDFSDDKDMYETYVKSGGTLTLEQYRRNNVSEFVASVYSLIKSYDESISFGISPSAKLDYNENTVYADVSLWCNDDGYIDYIMPQIYYGFENSTMPFEKTAEEWAGIAENKNVALYCGLALYKSLKPDDNAGDGKNEWVENSDILSRQYKVLQKNGYKGYALFSCSYIFGENSNENSKKEITALCDVLK